MGKIEHHVKEFAENVRTLEVGSDEELRSYDVPVLFTSSPVDKAMDVIRKNLEDYENLSKRTPLSPRDIITLLEVPKLYILLA